MKMPKIFARMFNSDGVFYFADWKKDMFYAIVRFLQDNSMEIESRYCGTPDSPDCFARVATYFHTPEGTYKALYNGDKHGFEYLARV